MLLVLFIWIIVFLAIIVWGFTASKLVRILLKGNNGWNELSLDEYFFFGFLILSALAGIISVFAPISLTLFLGVILIALLFAFIFFTELRLKIINAGITFHIMEKSFKSRSRYFNSFYSLCSC